MTLRKCLMGPFSKEMAPMILWRTKVWGYSLINEAGIKHHQTYLDAKVTRALTTSLGAVLLFIFSSIGIYIAVYQSYPFASIIPFKFSSIVPFNHFRSI